MLPRPLSLYLHIPFCDKKCSYCDFNSYAGIDSLMPAYTEAIIREIYLWSKACREYRVRTIYFGGGTPSRVPPSELARIIEALAGSFSLQPDCEISLEANPGTVSLAYLYDLHRLGVNRLSLGVQSFHDDELAFLDRNHSAEEARQTYQWARSAGFDNINLDLIYGLPGQPLYRWQSSLEEAIHLGPEHLSLYALTIEEGALLAFRVAKGEVPEPDPDSAADQYAWTIDRMSAAGYEQYEISNWARPGYCCRHNLTYWRNKPYLGLGAGAHSFFQGLRFANVAAPNRYIQAINESWQAAQEGDGNAPMRQILEGERVSPELEMVDTIILGLRLNEGIALHSFRDRFGVDLLERYGDAVEELRRLGLVEVAEGSLRLTPRGRFFHNDVSLQFLAADAGNGGRA